MRKPYWIASIALTLCYVGPCLAQSADSAPNKPATGMSSASADNSKMNARDRSDAASTPQTQNNNAADRKLLAKVRHAIVNDKSLSMMAHNVKIMVRSGAVTLRGPVNSEAEKAGVENVAKQVAGVSNIDNQLDIKTK